MRRRPLSTRSLLVAICSAFVGVPFLPRATAADVLQKGYHRVERTTIVRFAARPGWRLYASERGMVLAYRGDLLRSEDTLSYNGYQAAATLWWVKEARLQEIPCNLDSMACVDPTTDTSFHPVHFAKGEMTMYQDYQVPDSTGLIAQTEIYEIRDTVCMPIQIDRTYRIPYADRTGGKITRETELRSWPTVGAFPSRVVGGFGILGVRAAKAVVSIPGGTARLKWFTVTGRLHKELRIAATGGRPGLVDLGASPRVGEFLVLEQGERRSARFVLAGP